MTRQPGPSAYSDLAVLLDGTGLCVYERDNRFTVTGFTLEWLMVGIHR